MANILDYKLKSKTKEQSKKQIGVKKLYLPLCLRYEYNYVLCNFHNSALKKSVMKLSLSDAKHLMESDLIITFIHPLTTGHSVSLWPLECMSKEDTLSQHHLLTSSL